MNELIVSMLSDELANRHNFISVFLWTIIVLFLIGNSIWIVEMLHLGVAKFARLVSRAAGRRPISVEETHSLNEVQVRVLTIGDEDVVQRTINSLPDEIRDRQVIAEEPMDISGATVHVVPESFECQATKK